MQSSAVVSEPSPNLGERGRRGGAAEPGAYVSGREGKHFRQPRVMPYPPTQPLTRQAPAEPEVCQPADEQLDDLIYSWRRLNDPKLRTLAVQIIRSMAA